jgi:hypothetical protein
LGVPLLDREEFEVVIMIAVATEEMHGSDRVPDLRDYKRAVVGKSKTINESEMALFSECSPKCARKVLDTADIVREAMFRQLTTLRCRRGMF